MADILDLQQCRNDRLMRTARRAGLELLADGAVRMPEGSGMAELLAGWQAVGSAIEIGRRGARRLTAGEEA